MLTTLSLMLALVAAGPAASAQPTLYSIAMPDPPSHDFRIEVRLDDVRGPSRFSFPAYTPGGWKIDEVAKNVFDLTATDGAGKPLAASKIDKQTWTIAKPSDRTVIVSYRIYADEHGTPYAARLNATAAQANLATILGYAPDRLRASARLRLEVPPGWKVACSLPESSGGPAGFAADNFDLLADGIFLAGNWSESGFDLGTTHYRLVFSPAPDVKDRKVADDVRSIAREAAAVFGETPFSSYLFLYLLEADGGHGGIEHQFGTSICAPLDSFEDREAYRKFLGVTAHEFFHAWNVKRMRPEGLGPFDYTHEVYTHNLYVAEGFTTYYGSLAAVRGGAFTREEYFKNLAEGIVTDRDNVGIREKALQDQSWDWWLGSTIPYQTFRTNYSRGSLVALVLDLEIRDATGGQRSLDDAMRALYLKTGKRATGYTDAELREALAKDGNAGMDARLDELVTKPGRLDVPGTLARAGLEVVPDPDAPAVPVVGWRVSATGKEFPAIDWVEPGSPAARAGFQSRDVILSLNDRRVSADTLNREVRGLPPGRTAAVAFFRDGILHRADVTPGDPLPPKLIVRPRADATAPQKALLEGWLGARAGASSR